MKHLKISLFALKAKSPFAKSVLKATYPGNTDPPKEKHVISILRTLTGSSLVVSPEEAFSQLISRLVDKNWTSMLKAEIILHRGIEESSRGYSLSVSDLSAPIVPENSDKAKVHTAVIQDYFEYIKSKANNYHREGSALLISGFNYSDEDLLDEIMGCLLYTSPSPRDS